MAGGRPRKEIDYTRVADLASVMCTQEEIAAALDLSVRKLQMDDEFMRVYKRGIENAKTSLRRSQFKSATEGNVTMQIWLGKQYLGQRERPELDDMGEKVAEVMKEFLVNR